MLSKHEEQAERLDVLENEKRLKRGSPLSKGTSARGGSTFLSHTHNDIGGRFAAISSPVVVGEKKIPQYPAAYLQHDPVPDEPSLGYRINDLNPTDPPAEPSDLAPAVSPSVVQGSVELEPSSNPAQATPSSSSQVPPLANEELGFSQRAYRRF
jgi:hypothetical protein